MGFGNVSEYASCDDAGRTWFTQFRKAVSSATTLTAGWVDYTYFAGSPLANFYASTPLESAYVDSNRGFYLPQIEKQFLKNITMMCLSASPATVTGERQTIILNDYLMYYPFIDTDSTDQQDMTQAVTLPRYTSGRVIAVSQSASSTEGQFRFTYTNQDGVSGRISQNVFTPIVAGGGQLLNAPLAGSNSFLPFIPLQEDDTGVQSIESVTFTAVGGGLMALVIVKPLLSFLYASTTRRTISGNFESFGAAASIDSLINNPRPAEIKQGAVLGLIGHTPAGGVSSMTLSGYLETFWSN